MKDRTEIEHIVLRIRDLMSRSKRVTFTVEHGRGETYATADWTLYAHDRYPRSSVLCGKEPQVMARPVRRGRGRTEAGDGTLPPLRGSCGERRCTRAPRGCPWSRSFPIFPTTLTNVTQRTCPVGHVMGQPVWLPVPSLD